MADHLSRPNGPCGLKGIVYLRKSRADLELEALGQGETLARHRSVLLELARRQGIAVTQIFQEVVSGDTIAARPEMQKLLAAVEAGACDCVLVMEVERLARGDTMDQGVVAQTFQYSGTLIVTPAKTYDPRNPFDQEYFEFGLFMSRREYQTINRRLQAGRLAASKEGQYLGSKPPYGYRRLRLERPTRYTLAEEPGQGEAVRLIYRLYLQGEPLPEGGARPLGYGAIAETLDRLGVPTPTGAPRWSAATVAGILQNPVYAGKIKWKSRPSVKRMERGVLKTSRPRRGLQEMILADGLHPALVDLETWEAVQRRMAEHPSPLPGRRGRENPLAGLVRCAVCGKAMIRRPYKGTGAPDTLMCPTPHCPTVSSALSLVEERVIAALADRLRAYRLEASSLPDDGDRRAQEFSAALERGKQGLQELGAQRDRLYDLLEQGVYSTELFLERSAALAQRIEEAQAAQEQLGEALAREEERARNRERLAPLIQETLAAYWATDSPALRNQMLRQVLQRVVYRKDRGGRGYEDRFEVFLYVRDP